MKKTFTFLSISLISLFLSLSKVNGQCQSSFGFTQTQNTLTVNFADLSVTPAPGVITSWHWEFGDGTTNGDQNPHHTFSHDSTFHVCLTIHDNTGCSSQFCQDVHVNGTGANCHAAFTSAQTANTLSIEFSDASTSAGSLTSWLWNFGDGTISTESNPHHSFTHDGTFHVCLITHDNAGCVSDICHDVVVNPLAGTCHSFFTSAQTAGTLTMQFVDSSASSGNTISWHWEFGDGTEANDQNIAHTFPHDGIFHVCLTTHDDQGCSNMHCENILVVGTVVPVSCHALFVVTSTNNPFEYHFVDGSSTPDVITSWQWDFGDGTGSQGQNVSHVYTHDGSFHVCLTIHDNQGCSSTYCHEVLIQQSPLPCQAGFSFQPDSSGIVHFENTSAGTTANATYTWNFGDGISSNEENPNHHYDHPDHYTVCLFIHDSSTGCEAHYCHTIDYNQRNSHALVAQYYFVNDAGRTINVRDREYIVNYPNPFKSSTTIQYELTDDASVEIDIIDRNGSRVKNILKEKQLQGQHTKTISANGLSSGLYLLKMTVAGESFQKKIMILK